MKRLDRIMRALSEVLDQHPNTFFVILGREHPTEPLAGEPQKYARQFITSCLPSFAEALRYVFSTMLYFEPAGT